MEIIKFLIDKGADVNLANKMVNDHIQTILIKHNIVVVWRDAFNEGGDFGA